ncbi:uncharacterized protein DSM5745_06434 [Aspergillus mulundensis]|uniref:Uncharacterized protein n=1 Tax=Aspergillus mulundensis TaxID=1810919 RepID=A0A3D8RQT3_9EURO|nr:hypothetical protein DSM5745_06434 [Aspergillus mulundensis]RDW76442.1 hypothetical protein DSM5745_06434 [Aspergillus mulundensis]
MELARLAYRAVEDDDDDDIRELRRFFFLDQHMDNLRQVYHNVQAYGTLGQESTDEVWQPTIYCDLSRFKEVEKADSKGETVLLNTKTGVTTNLNEEYIGCKTTGATIAYTSVLRRPDDTGYTEITLCPWYLVEIGNAQYRNVVGGMIDRTGQASYDPGRGFKGNEPNADVWASRLDFTLLHEFSHALPITEGRTLDLYYKWEACVANGGEDTACLNADTYAYFALGVHCIKVPRVKFSKEGKHQLMRRAGKRAGQLIMKLWNA